LTRPARSAKEKSSSVKKFSFQWLARVIDSFSIFEREIENAGGTLGRNEFQADAPETASGLAKSLFQRELLFRGPRREMQLGGLISDSLRGTGFR
jgi:hypothetical protein